MVNQNKEKLNHAGYEGKCVVRPPKIITYISIVEIVVFSSFLFLMFFFPNGTESLFSYSVFIFFIILGIYLMYITNTWQIEFLQSEDYFVLTDYWRRKHVIYYSDCFYYKFRYNYQEILIHNRIKDFTIIPMLENSEFFLNMLIQHNVTKAD